MERSTIAAAIAPAEVGSTNPQDKRASRQEGRQAVAGSSHQNRQGQPARLPGVIGLLSREPKLQTLLADLKAARSTRLHGMPRAGHMPLAAALLTALNRPIVMVTPHAETVRELADNAALWLPAGRNVYDFPALESLPYERSDPEESLIQRRTAVLQRLSQGPNSAGYSATPPLIICPARALLQPLMDVDTFQRVMQVWRPGMRLPLSATVAHWLSLGYTEAPLVERLGQFARRGGIIDIFPAGEPAPVRIDLFGDEIDSLRAFDPATQRSSGSRTELTIAPLTAFTAAALPAGLAALRAIDRQQLLPHVQDKWDEDIKRLEEGLHIDNLSFYAPFLTAEGRSSLLDYLPANALLLIEEPEICAQTLEEMCDQAREIHEELTGRGETPAAMPDPLFEPAALQEVIAQTQRVEVWQRASVAAPADQPSLVDCDWSVGQPLGLPTTYAGRLKDFLHESAEQRRHGHRVIVVSLQGERLADLYAEDGIEMALQQRIEEEPAARSLLIVHAALSEGWTCPSLNLTVFSDAEIFGTTKARPVARFRNEAPRRAVLEFTPGDYVVHIEHGIGRFAGVVQMQAGSVMREYLDLNYAGTDRLYVPTDQLDRVTRYVGMGETAPALSKLGTSEWTRAKARVKESVAQIATELLELYSFRQTARKEVFSPDGKWQRELESSFPYVETPDQLKAIHDVKRDMESPRPMDRLVCGDVGYGKTEVALRAAFKAVLDGKQVALLVPTTILAQQHYANFKERMEAFPVKIAVMSRFQSTRQLKETAAGVADGSVDIVIGTHRLLQKDVAFRSLGLLIIDEEQRFGVKHKEKLRQLRRDVDVLTMTATPIPRSLHMSLVGVRDLSVIETAPEGRLPIKTYLQPFDDYHIREAILRELDRGGQVYFVHNRVQTIEAVAERLRRLVPEARFTVGHGQMPDDQLEKVMFDFAANESDVLVCSSIIESGLDIPNVNTMIVNDAMMFGLAQLYQLRGRIGRSSSRAYAYLLYRRDQKISRVAERRLRAIFEATELGAGYKIAMKDLEIRGAGNLLGPEQSGQMASVGFDLYCKLLADEISKRKGEARASAPPSASVDIPLDMYLPVAYVSHENQRLALYQRLAEVRDLGGLDEIAAELKDRFGDPPPEVTNLLTSLRIKLKAERAGVQSIKMDPEALVIKGTATVVFDRLSLHKNFGSAARAQGTIVRIPRLSLPEDWIDHLELILDDTYQLTASAHKMVRPG